MTITSGFAGDPTSKNTDIVWKEGKDLVKKANESQKASAGSKRQMAALSRTFFQWFTDNTDPSADDIAEVWEKITFLVFNLGNF